MRIASILLALILFSIPAVSFADDVDDLYERKVRHQDSSESQSDSDDDIVVYDDGVEGVAGRSRGSYEAGRAEAERESVAAPEQAERRRAAEQHQATEHRAAPHRRGGRRR